MDVEAIDKYDVARSLFSDMPLGFPFEGFDLQEIILPDGDNMGIASDDGEIDEDDIKTESGFGAVIVVGNLPVVSQDKYDKLLTVIRKLFAQVGTIPEGGLHMPVDEKTGMSKGYAFVEFMTPQEARAAHEQANGTRLDRNHTLVTNMFDELDRYAKVPDEYVLPEPKEFVPVENQYSWMLDKLGRDQFTVRHGDYTAVMWNDAKRNRCEPVYDRQHWTESFVQWSPQGTYLATMHRQGVAIWGGASFTRLMRYAHSGVRLIDISPNEAFLVTYSSQEPSSPRESVQVLLNVYDVRYGQKLRVFQGPADEYAVGSSAGPGGALKWPVFKWAGGRQDLYMARLARNAISVFEAPEMKKLDSKDIKLEAVQDFEWSASEPILAAYTAEQGNLPARIVLIKIPEKTEIRQKNLFSVSDIKILWHPQGDYLAVKVDRYTKTKKSTYTGFELFSIRDKDIPMEVLELPNKSEKIICFAWEPKGHRFCVVHGDGPRPNISFYSMKDDKGRLGAKLIGSLQGRACNQIFWSPQGHNIVLAGLKQLNGQLEFFSVDEMETMATAEHFMATDVEWDPTGRYVATSVSHVHAMENGFNMWTFQGRLVYTQAKDRLFQFSWRPRLPSLLPPEKEAEVVKNLKVYSKRYEEEDEALLMQADADVLQDRQRLTDTWVAFQASVKDYVAERERFKREVYGARYEEGEFTVKKVVLEHITDVKEEPYQPK